MVISGYHQRKFMTPSQNPNLHPLRDIPSGMDNDPNADEEVIDQTGPEPSEEETDLQPPGTGRIPSEMDNDPANDANLNEKIAYALGGAEPKK